MADGKEYAVKCFDASALDAGGRRTLLNEVRLLAALHHPHIVSFKEAYAEETGEMCVVMELMKGDTLGGFIRRAAAEGRRLPEDAVWRLFLQLADALAHMHACNVAHRDLKPANIMFCDTTCERLKLLDLGLARRADDLGMSQVWPCGGGGVGVWRVGWDALCASHCPPLSRAHAHPPVHSHSPCRPLPPPSAVRHAPVRRA